MEIKKLFYKYNTLSDKATPYLAIESGKVVDTLKIFQQHFGAENVYYAVKANPDTALIALLQNNGCNFEVSSIPELELCTGPGVPASRIISAGTIKTPDFIRDAFKTGVKYFTADCVSEVEQIARQAPGSNLVVRLIVSNEGSEWPLTRKFGVTAEEAAGLLIKARESGLTPYGLSFHVGSQCTLAKTWEEAIVTASRAWEAAKQNNISLKSLNLGGGFPISYQKPVPPIEDIAATIHRSLKHKIPDAEEVLVEPGRALVGHAGTIVASVTAKAVRNKQRWLYLDIGVFNGLMESIGGIKYDYKVGRQGKPVKWVLSGPSCDSMDIIDKSVYLPDVEIGDHVFIRAAGAYTTAYASKFCGLPIPEIYLIQD
ncbi:type III PLP-dependent enzyme [Chloroflexota bacterium]